jgi:hypothetical protein
MMGWVITINQKSGIVVAFVIKFEYFLTSLFKKKFDIFLQLMDIRENLEIREDRIISGKISSVRSRLDWHRNKPSTKDVFQN